MTVSQLLSATEGLMLGYHAEDDTCGAVFLKIVLHKCVI